MFRGEESVDGILLLPFLAPALISCLRDSAAMRSPVIPSIDPSSREYSTILLEFARELTVPLLRSWMNLFSRRLKSALGRLVETSSRLLLSIPIASRRIALPRYL